MTRSVISTPNVADAKQIRMRSRTSGGGCLSGRTLNQLREFRDPFGAMLTVYVTTPSEASSLREVLVAIDRVLATAHPECIDQPSRRRAITAMSRVREAVAERWRYWIGRSMLIVAGAGGVLVEHSLPCPIPDLAVFGRRVAIRYAVRAHQQTRPYTVVVVDGSRPWQFDMTGRTVRRVGEFNGLDGGTNRAVVVGGPPELVAQFRDSLPTSAQASVVGTFTMNPYVVTAAAISARAHAVMRLRDQHRQEMLAAALAEQEAAGQAVVARVEACVRAVSNGGADLLVVRGDSLIAGWLCDKCGVISTYNAICSACEGPCLHVPDLVEEMLVRMFDAGRRVDLATADHVNAGIAVQLIGQ
jgi:hypothetical protein